MQSAALGGSFPRTLELEYSKYSSDSPFFEFGNWLLRRMRCLAFLPRLSDWSEKEKKKIPKFGCLNRLGDVTTSFRAGRGGDQGKWSSFSMEHNFDAPFELIVKHVICFNCII